MHLLFRHIPSTYLHGPNTLLEILEIPHPSPQARAPHHVVSRTLGKTTWYGTRRPTITYRSPAHRCSTIWRKSPSSSSSTTVNTTHANGFPSLPISRSSTSETLVLNIGSASGSFLAPPKNRRSLARQPVRLVKARKCRARIMTSQPRRSHRWYPGGLLKRWASASAFWALSAAAAPFSAASRRPASRTSRCRCVCARGGNG